MLIVDCLFISPPSPAPTQLGQLEVAIREHKQEMMRKVESLQQSLEVRERELGDAQRELADTNSKVRFHRSTQPVREFFFFFK